MERTAYSFLRRLGYGTGPSEHVWGGFSGYASTSDPRLLMTYSCMICGLVFQTYLGSPESGLDDLALPHRCDEMIVPMVMLE